MAKKSQTPKISIYVSGGMVQGVRSNIGANIKVEIVDDMDEPEKAEGRWEKLQTELPYGNY